MDAVPSRIEHLLNLQPGAPSTRLGDSLKQLSDETSDLPIGAVVLLSDGDDNTGGISADSVSARCVLATFRFTPWASDASAPCMTWSWTMSWLLRAPWPTPRIAAAKITLHQTRIRQRQDQPDDTRRHHRPSQNAGLAHHRVRAGRQSPDRDVDV